MVRFDGYHVLADLTGVPDLYSRMGPTLRGLLPGHRDDARATALKPWARAVVTAWVLVVVPLLLFTLVLMVLALPRVLATAWAACGNQAHALTVDWAGGDVAGVAVRMLAIVAVSLPVLGSLLTLVRLVRSTTASVWQATEGQARSPSGGRPGGRCPGGGPGLGLVARRRDRYRPMQAFERGAVVDGLEASGVVGPQLRDGQVVNAPRTVWACRRRRRRPGAIPSRAGPGTPHQGGRCPRPARPQPAPRGSSPSTVPRPPGRG